MEKKTPSCDDGAKRNKLKKVVGKINCGYYQKIMKRMIGYMVTWTTYGTWLQGDKRGYVKDGKTLAQNDKLKSANQRQPMSSTVLSF